MRKLRTIACLAAILCIQLCVGTAYGSLDSGLVGYWDFDEAQGDSLYDKSPTGYNIGCGGLGDTTCPVRITPGVLAGGMLFDGLSDMMSLGSLGWGDDPYDTVTGEFTMSLWAKPTGTRASTDESNNTMPIYTGCSGQRYAIYPQNRWEDDKTGAGVSVGTNGISVFVHTNDYMPSTLVYNASFDSTEWIHIAVVYRIDPDSNYFPTLYVNGDSVRAGLPNSAPTPSAAFGEVGTAYGYYKGALDEVRIYNRPLTADEIRTLSKPFYSRWTFDEGQGDTAHDLSHLYNGVLNNDSNEVVWSSSGVDSNCIQFTSDTPYVNLQHISELDSTSTFSLLGWFKFDTVSVPYTLFHIQKTANQEEIRIYTSNDTLFVSVCKDTIQRGYFKYGSYIQPDQWYFLAVVLNGSGATNSERLKFYLNSVPITLSYINTIPTTTAKLTGANAYLGRPDNAGSFKGYIDELTLYYCPLSAKGIEDEYYKYRCSDARCKDSLALVALYNATNGPGWTTKTNWMSPTQGINTWYGVTVSSNRVSQLNLTGDSLRGPLPASLGNLTGLTSLILEANHISGSIPSSLGSLTNLKYLYLPKNKLTGSIPSALGNLKKLERLYLYSNLLTGSIPQEIGDIDSMRIIYINNNSLAGQLPSSLGSLSKLTHLRATTNQLSGTLPNEISNLANLQQLQLAGNQFSGALPDSIGKLSNLNRLEMHANSFSGIPAGIGDLSNLLYFYFSENQITSLPAEITNLAPTILEAGTNELCNVSSSIRTWLNTYDSDWESTQDCP